MRFLVSEKLGPHKYKTPEGYLICTDAILSRTGKQEYKRSELFGDACEEPDKVVNVDRLDDEVFSDKAMASFENKPICIEHPDENVTADNFNDLAVGFVRDVHKGEYNGHPVMRATLVITDKDAIADVESGEYCELSCGYDCDIQDENEPKQTNIRGNHVALCKQGRAGIARIIDSTSNSVQAIIDKEITMEDIIATKKPGADKILYVMQSDADKNLYFYIGKTFAMKEGSWGYTKFEMSNTNPVALKNELTKNGWHQVSSGPAKVIDVVISNEQDVMKDFAYRPYTFQVNFVALKNAIRNSDKKSLDVMVKTLEKDICDFNSWKSELTEADKAKYYDKMKEVVEPLRKLGYKLSNYIKNSKEINMNDSKVKTNDATIRDYPPVKRWVEHITKAIGEDDMDEYVDDIDDDVVHFLSNTPKSIVDKVEKYLRQRWAYEWELVRRGNEIRITKPFKKDSLKMFEVSYVKDGITRIYKVKAKSMADAIKKVKATK